MSKLLKLSVLCILNMQVVIAGDGIKKISIPNIKGYNTLIADFHSHTVYSDGDVMPYVRVGEAFREGIHVIAVTEHIEDYCRKVPETKNVDLNTSYNLHVQAADSNLIVIRGGEISRGMPPGHLNALFLKDVNDLDTEHTDEGIWKAVENAISQGAFIIWNHPGWKWQQPDTTKWFDFHTQLYERGFIHGIEITNWTDGCCKEALNWYKEKNLAPISGADTHGPTAYDFDLINSHRPVTLVFTKDRTEAAVKEALFDKRTLAYDNNFLYGANRWLTALFETSIDSVEFVKKKGKNLLFSVHNCSDLNYELVIDHFEDDISAPERITLTAQGYTEVQVKATSSAKCLKLRYKCLNMFSAVDENPIVELVFEVK